MNLYFDNAATSFPKPPSVCNDILNYMTTTGANAGRSAYSSSLDANRLVYSTRETIANFFNFPKPENVIFTMNITHALNILIKGCIQPGWHVITSSMEHNSVLRPLNTLKRTVDFELDIIECSKEGIIDLDAFRSSIKNNTKLVILSQASNIIGTIQPLRSIGHICKEKGIYFIVDGAQSSGSIPVDFTDLNCNAFCFTGHKALMGPQGIGGFMIDDELNSITSTLYEGGSGSSSDYLYQPDFLPDKFECGTLNTPAIGGLASGINYIKNATINSICEKEKLLIEYFNRGINDIENIITYSPTNIDSTPVISLNHLFLDPSHFSYILSNDYGIMTRSGLHCAPLAHKTIGTFPTGTVRFSLGAFHEKSDIDYVLESLICINKTL